ncbi:hypothetical protein [Leuconostoc mesenteroides]|uniref:hypothetical protein n=1 Tax=Leuconostoc mesenteroides TaxID=1245 RepID=UPI0021A397E3|nr:hypothetical protein [Leuconostoc mesenteroides]MCT3050177.1 hypothetical protein [Leuconostoc mesenteroides]
MNTIILKRGTTHTTANMSKFKRIIDDPLNSLVLSELLNVYVKADSEFNVVNITEMANEWSKSEEDIVNAIRQLISLDIFVEV